jgi:hypothetical protein
MKIFKIGSTLFEASLVVNAAMQMCRGKRLWCEITEVGEDGVVSRFVPVEELFAGRHFAAEIVALCVRWHLSFKLS